MLKINTREKEKEMRGKKIRRYTLHKTETEKRERERERRRQAK